MNPDDRYSLMIHGGAGALDELRDTAQASRYDASVRRILEHGRDLLRRGESALEVVMACATLLEDDPMFNAGRGSVLNEAGRVEMDAAIMDGRDLRAGAVAAVHNLANPIRLARLVMSETRHVMLIGEGTMRFAAQQGLDVLPDEAFRFPHRVAQLDRARAARTTLLDHADRPDDGSYGTIGAIARDTAGNLAAATSTGGVTNKRLGRVGDSPIIGAGVYADNASCAVSATGHGEDFMRCVLAKTIADFIDMQGMDGAAATRSGVDYLRRKVQGRGGVIVIDHHGRCTSACTTRNMIHGWIEHGGITQTRL